MCDMSHLADGVSICYSCGVPTLVRYQREPLTDSLWDDALPLLVEHWRECGNDTPFRPSLTSYGQLEANGVLRVFTAREWLTDDERSEWYTEMSLRGLSHSEAAGSAWPDKDQLLGYAMFTTMPSLNTGALEAQQAAIYVSPEYRGDHGAKFIAYCSEQLFLDGVELVYQIDTVARPLGALLARQGFECKGTVWAKRNPAHAMNADLCMAMVG